MMKECTMNENAMKTEVIPAAAADMALFIESVKAWTADFILPEPLPVLNLLR